MKRSLSMSLSPEPDMPVSQNIPSSPATPKKPKTLPKSRDVAHSPTKKSPEKAANGQWTAEKRQALMTDVISAGMVALGGASLADKYGLTKAQVGNAMQAGKPGNLRDKAVKAVRGE